MNTYHKIDTLFERDTKFNVQVGRYRNPVIHTINEWLVTEKIDGTNIRVHLTENDEMLIGGRTDKAKLHGDLIKHLQETFSVDKLISLRRTEEPVEITLFGEGYGAGIQKGGGDYRPDKGFILFDVLINNKYWLSDEAVTEIADKLDIPRVPVFGTYSLEAIINLVRSGFTSLVGNGRAGEGIVARPLTPLYDYRHRRLIIKLKTSDFLRKE